MRVTFHTTTVVAMFTSLMYGAMQKILEGIVMLSNDNRL